MLPALRAPRTPALQHKPPASSPSWSRSPFRSANPYSRSDSATPFSRARPVAPSVRIGRLFRRAVFPAVGAAGLEEPHVALPVVQVPGQRLGHAHQAVRAQPRSIFGQRIGNGHRLRRLPVGEKRILFRVHQRNGDDLPIAQARSAARAAGRKLPRAAGAPPVAARRAAAAEISRSRGAAPPLRPGPPRAPRPAATTAAGIPTAPAANWPCRARHPRAAAQSPARSRMASISLSDTSEPITRRNSLRESSSRSGSRRPGIDVHHAGQNFAAGNFPNQRRAAPRSQFGHFRIGAALESRGRFAAQPQRLRGAPDGDGIEPRRFQQHVVRAPRRFRFPRRPSRRRRPRRVSRRQSRTSPAKARARCRPACASFRPARARRTTMRRSAKPVEIECVQRLARVPASRSWWRPRRC